MAAAGSVAVLLPGAFYFLRETKLPPIAACARRGADRHVHRPQPRLVAHAVAAADAEHGLHPVPPDARRGPGRHDPPRRHGPGPGRTEVGQCWQAGQRADFCPLGRGPPERAGLCLRPAPGLPRVAGRRRAPRQVSAPGPPTAGARTGGDAQPPPSPCAAPGRTPLLLSLPHVGTVDPRGAAPGLPPSARWRWKTPTGCWNELYELRPCRDWAPACWCRRCSRYVIDLNRPPAMHPMYPGANNTELCPTRFFTGEPLYREGMAPDDAQEKRASAAQTLYWQPYHDALAGELAACTAQHGHALLFDGHSIQPSCPGCSRAVARPEPGHGRWRAVAHPSACASALAAVLAGQTRLQPGGGRPLQGRPHHAQHGQPAQGHPRGAAGDVLALLHAGARRHPGCRPVARGAHPAGAAGAVAGHAAGGWR